MQFDDDREGYSSPGVPFLPGTCGFDLRFEDTGTMGTEALMLMPPVPQSVARLPIKAVHTALNNAEHTDGTNQPLCLISSDKSTLEQTEISCHRACRVGNAASRSRESFRSQLDNCLVRRGV
ncbi:hypothetical protein K0M31_018678, partial [Melipona bicolor]